MYKNNQPRFKAKTVEIHDHEHEVFIECEALKEAVNSLATHDNLGVSRRLDLTRRNIMYYMFFYAFVSM